jgi:EAL domain-containing protein (putative c-di-GMP-specific phosphodiesterase class I)
MNVRPDIVKLDRALVHGIAHDPVRAALIECFAGFARRTGTDVCAEGIERPDDLVALAALGVRYGQGYRLARPAAGWPVVAPDAVAALGAVAEPAAS